MQSIEYKTQVELAHISMANVYMSPTHALHPHFKSKLLSQSATARAGGFFTHLNKPLPQLQLCRFPAVVMLNFTDDTSNNRREGVSALTSPLCSLRFWYLHAFCWQSAVFKSLLVNYCLMSFASTHPGSSVSRWACKSVYDIFLSFAHLYTINLLQYHLNIIYFIKRNRLCFGIIIIFNRVLGLPTLPLGVEQTLTTL